MIPTPRWPDECRRENFGPARWPVRFGEERNICPFGFTTSRRNLAWRTRQFSPKPSHWALPPPRSPPVRSIRSAPSTLKSNSAWTTPSWPPNSPRHRRPRQKPRPANPLSSLKRRRRNRQNRRSKQNRRRSLKHPNRLRHLQNRRDQRLAKKSGSFNCPHARRAWVTKPVRSNIRRRVKARRKKRNPDKLTVQPPVVKRRLHRAKPPNPPRHSPNLSRLQPAKSSSSNRRLLCVNSPRNSSRGRSRSLPI